MGQGEKRPLIEIPVSTNTTTPSNTTSKFQLLRDGLEEDARRNAEGIQRLEALIAKLKGEESPDENLSPEQPSPKAHKPSHGTTPLPEPQTPPTIGASHEEISAENHLTPIM